MMCNDGKVRGLPGASTKSKLLLCNRWRCVISAAMRAEDGGMLPSLLFFLA
jgi:hypothetical protein